MASTTPKRRTVADQVNDLIATSVRFEHVIASLCSVLRRCDTVIGRTIAVLRR